MSHLVSNAVVVAVALVFVASLPRRHIRVESSRRGAAVISAPDQHVDVWYKPAPSMKLDDLPDWTRDDTDDDSPLDMGVKPPWGMFSATAAFAVYSILDGGDTIHALMSAMTAWSFPVMGIAAVFVYLSAHGFRYSLGVLFAVVTLLGLLFGITNWERW